MTERTLLTLAVENGWEVLGYHQDSSALMLLPNGVYLEFRCDDDGDWNAEVSFSCANPSNPKFMDVLRSQMHDACATVFGASKGGNA